MPKTKKEKNGKTKKMGVKFRVYHQILTAVGEALA
jgi:hypothetical protein